MSALGIVAPEDALHDANEALDRRIGDCAPIHQDLDGAAAVAQARGEPERLPHARRHDHTRSLVLPCAHAPACPHVLRRPCLVTRAPSCALTGAALTTARELMAGTASPIVGRTSDGA